MKKILINEKRKKAKELFNKGWSIRKISKHLVSGKDNVGKWVKMSDEEIENDNRGWEKGRLRKYTNTQKEAISNIRKELEKEDSFFIGAKVVCQNYINLYKENISEKFAERTIKEYNLQKRHQKKKRGKSKYMNYPEKTLSKSGKIMMSIDFIGPKYLKGSNDRINFLSCKYIRPIKEGIVKKVSGQTAEEAINVLTELWKSNPIPDVLKVDNDAAFGGYLPIERCIGRLTLFLLNLGVIPLYIAPRSPWNNGDVEGFNSVFSKKFWNKLKFTDEDEINVKIKDFNVAYEKYSHLIDNNAEIKRPKYINDFDGIDFNNKQTDKFKVHKIYFLRIVRRQGDKGEENEKGYINILGKEIILKQDLINLFVFCELNLKEENLVINTENASGQLIKIKRIKFKIKNINT